MVGGKTLGGKMLPTSFCHLSNEKCWIFRHKTDMFSLNSYTKIHLPKNYYTPTLHTGMNFMVHFRIN